MGGVVGNFPRPQAARACTALNPYTWPIWSLTFRSSRTSNTPLFPVFAICVGRRLNSNVRDKPIDVDSQIHCLFHPSCPRATQVAQSLLRQINVAATPANARPRQDVAQYQGRCHHDFPTTAWTCPLLVRWVKSIFLPGIGTNCIESFSALWTNARQFNPARPWPFLQSDPQTNCNQTGASAP